jgi:hypothetical protein
MTDVALEPTKAELLVEARLGRRPQDMLEAAVVLEAWAGLPAQAALAAARKMMPAVPREAQVSVGQLPARTSRDGVLLEGSALIVTVIAIACWAAPLTSSIGVGAVERALMLALPLTLALQWALRARYLDRTDGLAQLAGRAPELALGASVVVGVPALALGVGGAVAGLLTVTWTGGTILIRRRWPAVYGGLILLATPAMILDLPALAVLGTTAVLTVVGVALALRGWTAPEDRSPGHWQRALSAGLIGAGLGLMLVLDATVSWTDGAVPALALLPSTVGAFWGGYHLRHLERAIPGALSGVSAREPERRGLAWPPLRVLLGAGGRLLVLCGALSAALLAATPWLGTSARSVGILAGFALLALATLLVSLLESMGRGRWSVIAVACAAATALGLRLSHADPFPGAGMVAGGALAIVLVLPAVLALLSRPASTLATALWIR